MPPMEPDKRDFKPLITFLIILILFEIVIVWYMIRQFRENYLSGPEALAVALEDAGLAESDADDPDIDLRHKQGRAWYEISFEAEEGDASYFYEVDAETGEILSSSRED